MNIQQISESYFVLNLVIRVLTAFVFAMFIIPLQLKEAGVKNGLKTLRKELLVSGVILFLLNVVAIIIVLFRNFSIGEFGDTIQEILSLVNAVGFLALGVVEYKIYTFSYTPENKKLHQRFAKMEKKEHKKATQLTTNKKVK